MKTIKTMCIFFALCFGIGQIDAQTLDDFRKEYSQKLFDVNFMRDYALALKKTKHCDKKEYEQISNNYALISSFYFFQKLGFEDEKKKATVPNVDIDAIKKAKLPLTTLHQAEIDFILAYQKQDYKKQLNILNLVLQQPMPKDNMCDIVIIGAMLNSLIEQGNLKDAKDYLAYLKDYAAHPANKDMEVQVKGAIENCQGYIMLKEFENNENK